MAFTDGDERAAIEATAVAYLTAFNQANADAVLATYADDGVLMAPGMAAVVGKDELAKVYPAVFAAVAYAMRYDIVEVAQISADWGFVRSRTQGSETQRAAGSTVEAVYQELFLLRRSPADGWRIARYCTSKIAPAV